MKSLGGVKKISIYDSYFLEDEPSPEGNLELGISKDSKIYYEGQCIPNIDKDRSYASFKGYRGKIFIPSNIGVTLNVLCDISGIIGFPAYIRSSMNDNLIIDRNKGLELIVYNEDAIIINKNVWSYGGDLKENREYSRYGRNFDYLSDIYLDFLINNSTTPVIKRGKLFDYAKFSEQNGEFSPIEVCIHHNLVCINKSSGIANVYYIPPFDARVSNSIKLHDAKNCFRVFQNQMNENLDPDRYKEIQRKMTNLKRSMSTLNLKIQEEYALLSQKEKEKTQKRGKKKTESSTQGQTGTEHSAK